jgi:NSS family neurotransmitter:Na+ symporter
VGFLECVVIGWFFDVRSFREYISSVSEIRAGAWWTICIKYITPLVLGYSIVGYLYQSVRAGYGTPPYPTWAVLLFGWGVIALVVVASFALSGKKTEQEDF